MWNPKGFGLEFGPCKTTALVVAVIWSFGRGHARIAGVILLGIGRKATSSFFGGLVEASQMIFLLRLYTSQVYIYICVHIYIYMNPKP